MAQKKQSISGNKTTKAKTTKKSLQVVENTQEEKDKGGRPPKWATPEELEADIIKYIQWCIGHEESYFTYTKANKQVEKKRWVSNTPMLLSGFCVFCDVNTDLIAEYEKKPEFNGTIKKLKSATLHYAESLLMNPNNRNAAGVIFNMKNNYNWTDRSEIALSGGVTTELSPEAQAIMDKASRANGTTKDS